MRHPTGKRFVGSLETANTEQRNHTHVFRDFQQSFDLVFFKAFHWSGVITKCLRCPHHSGKRDHDMAIDPEIETRLHSSSFARRPAEYASHRSADFCILLVREAMLFGDFQHLVEVALFPALRVTTRHDYRAGFFHFGLVVSSCTQLFLLVTIPNHHKPPGLQVITARRTQPGRDDFFEISTVDRYFLKARRGAPFLYDLTQQFLSGDLRHGWGS